MGNLSRKKAISITIDNSLAEYKDKVLFPEKLAKANEVLKKIGLPKLSEKQDPSLLARVSES